MDESLFLKAAGKDPDAFVQLMRSEMPALYKTARAILKSDEDASDAIQETILSCWEKIGTLRKPRAFHTWMIRILVNKCRDMLRTSPVHVSFDDRSGQTADVAYTEVSYQESEWTEVLSGLDEAYRLPMILYYVDGLGIREIAGLLELEPGAVRTRLHRGRLKLRELIQQSDDNRHFSAEGRMTYER